MEWKTFTFTASDELGLLGPWAQVLTGLTSWAPNLPVQKLQAANDAPFCLRNSWKFALVGASSILPNLHLAQSSPLPGSPSSVSAGVAGSSSAPARTPCMPWSAACAARHGGDRVLVLPQLQSWGLSGKSC